MPNKDAKFPLKIVINKQKTKVLFAEAGSDFVDVLLSFLTLPLGKILKVLKDHYGNKDHAIGSLTTLYDSLAELDASNFWEEGCKQMLLDPRSSAGTICLNLKLDINDCRSIRCFGCPNLSCPYKSYNTVSLYQGVATCYCGKLLTREVPFRNDTQQSKGENGVFVKSGTTFLIWDELLIMLNSPTSAMRILDTLGITDLDWHTKDVTFGNDEVMELLKGLFLSETPLTDIMRGKADMNLARQEEPRISPPKVERKQTASDNSKTMKLNVVMQKSTNKVLCAEADEVFIDFLFHLLALPLGGVGNLLGHKTSVTNVDNLCSSATSYIEGKYFVSPSTITSLVNPTLPHGYTSSNHILSLQEEEACNVYYYHEDSQGGTRDFISPPPNFSFHRCSLKYHGGGLGGSLLKGARTYLVSDDLSVTPASCATYLPILGRLKIPLSDVTQQVVHIGLEEALCILKASLVSKSALSSGLNHLLMKQPKQENE